MPGSKRNISKKNIEMEIYKTFELFKNDKSVNVVDFLNKLQLPTFQEHKYRTIKYTYESLFKLLLYKELKGIRFQTQLERYLKNHKEDRELLGLFQIPNQRTISYFLNNILDNEDKELIDLIIKKVEEISSKFGILLDINIFKPQQPEKKLAQRTIYHNKQQKTREISKQFKKRFSTLLDLNIDKNALYSKNDFINLLLHMCNTNDFAENGSHTFKLQQQKTPNGDTLLYHLKNYDDLDQLKRMFVSMFEMIWETARKANHFPRTVDCSIDYTSWHFYGDKNAPMVTEMKPYRGTTHCYKFTTINIS
ncbi:MAG: hypothetical protein DRO67_08615 [Candidatus Asgardarchaeum californiense]|nr:MAG: hypothetical protein DRO67_08615 [Candidatus Asgardarchaeum californiense]